MKQRKDKAFEKYSQKHPVEAAKQLVRKWLNTANDLELNKNPRKQKGGYNWTKKGKPHYFNKKGWGRKPKIDRFAKQKKWLKEWNLVNRDPHTTYLGYITADKYLRTIYKHPQQVHKPVKKLTLSNNRSQKSNTFLLTATNQFNEVVLDKIVHNKWLQQERNVVSLKQPLTVYDKVFYYYTLQTPLTLYAHKAFILLEMQLNATLVRAKLVPYLFMVRDLCFYRLVNINKQIAKNPHQVISLYDAVHVPIYLHNYMYCRQYRIQYYPQRIGLFFKNYWAHFTNYTNNKVWLLSNFITSDVTAETIVFDYPNITLYMGPFKRFTKLYYKNHPYAPRGKSRHLNHTHTVLKLKLFEYAAFYR